LLVDVDIDFFAPGCLAIVSTACRGRWQDSLGCKPRRWSTRGHAFEGLPSGVRNPDPADIDQLGACIDDLMSDRYQPSLSQKEKHPIRETEVKHPRFGAALPVDEQL
jgi:hypothetical protein